jgi:hypothetical protein
LWHQSLVRLISNAHDNACEVRLTVDVPLVRTNLARPRPLVEERAVGIVVCATIPQDSAGRYSANKGEEGSSRNHIGRNVNVNERSGKINSRWQQRLCLLI